MLLKNRKCIILWTNGAKTTLLQVSLCIDTCNQFIALSFGFFIGKKGERIFSLANPESLPGTIK